MKLPVLDSNFFRGTSYASSGQVVQAGIAPQQIFFKDGWDDEDNSNVKKYTKETATQFLRSYSDEMKLAIDSPKCTINVTKGCHQPGDAHFTLNGVGSKPACASIYGGSRSIHVPCP